MIRIWIDPYRPDTRIREITQFIETERQYKVDFSSSATARGTTVDSATWSSEGAQLLTIANESVTSGIATADVSSEGSGFATLKCVATYADGNTESAYVRIRVEDPECNI